MFYYYKSKKYTNMLDKEFHIDHIIPKSSEWKCILDKDRTCNLIPMISKLNTLRGNKHINWYKRTDEGKNFCVFIQDIIPSDNVYDNIIDYERKPKIKNNDKYNEMCEKNEKLYQINFINSLFI